MRDSELLESTREIVTSSRVLARAAVNGLLTALNDPLWDLKDRHHFDLHGHIFHAKDLVDNVLSRLEEIDRQLGLMIVDAYLPPEGRDKHDSREAARAARA
jgi:hypothetical protein